MKSKMAFGLVCGKNVCPFLSLMFINVRLNYQKLKTKKKRKNFLVFTKTG